ncbi:MAG: hypothetical protein C5B53_08560, partial [Candidatus Melainabacteria bacterium]
MRANERSSFDPGPTRSPFLEQPVNERLNLAQIARDPAQSIFSLDGIRAFLRKGQKALVEKGIITDLSILELVNVYEPPQPVGDLKSLRMEEVQDALLILLRDQIVVNRKPGQSDEDAKREAKQELDELLNAVRSERDNHTFGPASVAALKRFEDLFQSRMPKELQARTLGPDDAYGTGFEEFNRQKVMFLERKRRANVYQDQFIALMPHLLGKVEPRKGEPPDVTEKRRLAEITRETQLLQEERDLGIWGPASKRNYTRYQDWYNENSRAAVEDLRSLKLPLPAVNPLRLLLGWAEIPENPELFQALYIAGKRNPQKKNDPERALESEYFTDFLETKKFLERSSALAAPEHARIEAEAVKTLITMERLPSRWLEGADEDPRVWLATSTRYVNLALRARRLVELADHLNEANKKGGWGASDIPFPAGVIFDPDEYGQKARNEDGSLKGFRLPLPVDIRGKHPYNDYQYRELLKWCDDHETEILERIGDYRAAQQNPDLALTFSNFECHGKLACIDKEGKYIGLVDPNDPLRPGEVRRVPCNLICGRTRIVERNGKKYIVQTIEAWDIDKYLGYQNWKGDLVARVGPKEKELDPKKIYMVLSGDELIPVPGSSLEHELKIQEVKLRSEQILVPLMDAALIISGIGEGLTALRAARAAEATMRLSGKELAWQLGKSGLRITAGATGVFNSAGGRDTQLGRGINHARTAYFVCDIVHGWGRGTGILRTTELPGVVPTATKLEEAANGSRWLWATTGTANVTFKVTEYGFIPFIVRDVKNVGERALGLEDRDRLRDASLVLGDGLGFKSPEKGCFDLNNPLVLKQEVDALARYRDALKDSCTDEESRKQITEILDEAQELLKPGADPEKVRAFKLKLLSHFMYGDDPYNRCWLLIEPGKGNQGFFELMSASHIRAVHDPKKLEGMDARLRDHVKSHRGIVDPNVRAAAAIALLTLSRDSDGKLPEELSDVTVRFGWGKSEETVKTKYIVRLLLLDLKPPQKEGPSELPCGTSSHRVVVGEFLTRVQGINGLQYGLLLQDVLENPKSSSADKMRALSDPACPRLATIIDGLRQVVASGASKDETTELEATIKSLEATLQKTALSDNDPDVRAMAAMHLFGLRHPDRVAAEQILQQNNARWQNLKDKPTGTYAKEVRAFLEHECQREIPLPDANVTDPKQRRLQEQKADLARAERLNAALRLADLIDKDDIAGQKKVAEIIASCLSPTNVQLSVRVLEQLIPNRIKLLEPNSARAVREKALALLQVPNVEGLVVTADQEKEVAATVVLIKQLRFLLKDADPELKRMFCTKLENMLDPREVCKRTISDDLYTTLKETLKPKGSLPEAKLFPELKVAAIEGLADFGSQSSMPLIRMQLVGETKIGKQTYLFPDAPEVRCAAVKALQILGDPELRDLLPKLIRKEFNPAVSQCLLDIQADLPSLEPQKPAEKQQEKYEEASLDYRTEKFSIDDGLRYLKQPDYRLLISSNYAADAKKVDAAASWGWYHPDFRNKE